MECTGCKDPDAYVGLDSIDCLNPDCSHFKESYLEEKLKESSDIFDLILERLGLGPDDLREILSKLRVREIIRLGIPKSPSDKDTKCDS